MNDTKCELWIVINIREMNQEICEWNAHCNDRLSNASHLMNNDDPDHCQSE